MFPRSVVQASVGLRAGLRTSVKSYNLYSKSTCRVPTKLQSSRAFHMTPRPLGILPFKPLVEQPPGNIVGTVNEAVPVPESHKTHGSYHWTLEKLVNVGFVVPLALSPIVTGDLQMVPMLDAAVGSLIIIHAQMGLESCIVDYIPKREWGWLFNGSMGLLYAGTIVSLIGLYEYETNDIGLTGTVKKVWNA